jgi:hypothetical protein
MNSALARHLKSLELEFVNADRRRPVAVIEARSLKVGSATFDCLAGKYQFTSGIVLTFTSDSDKLNLNLPDRLTIDLQAVSETLFIISQFEAEIMFEKNSDGKVTGLVLIQDGRAARALKIK